MSANDHLHVGRRRGTASDRLQQLHHFFAGGDIDFATLSCICLSPKNPPETILSIMELDYHIWHFHSTMKHHLLFYQQAPDLEAARLPRPI